MINRRGQEMKAAEAVARTNKYKSYKNTNGSHPNHAVDSNKCQLEVALCKKLSLAQEGMSLKISKSQNLKIRMSPCYILVLFCFLLTSLTCIQTSFRNAERGMTFLTKSHNPIAKPKRIAHILERNPQRIERHKYP